MNEIPDRLQQVVIHLREFARQREWDSFHDPKNLVMLLASEVGELLAEYRWVSNERSLDHSIDPVSRERIVGEIGDVGIALLMLCDRVGVDLCTAVEHKTAVNARNYPLEESRGRAERPRGASEERA